jgi:hypothetical protein
MVFTPDLKTSLRSGQSSHRPEVAASGYTDLAEVTGPDGDLTMAHRQKNQAAEEPKNRVERLWEPKKRVVGPLHPKR